MELDFRLGLTAFNLRELLTLFLYQENLNGGSSWVGGQQLLLVGCDVMPSSPLDAGST